MKKYLKNILVLTSICLVVGLLMAITNEFTAPIIEKNAQNTVNKSLLVVLPNGEDFEKIDTTSYNIPPTVTEAYKEKNGGFVVNLVTSGYGDNLKIMCGIDADKKITGAICLSSNETLGFEKEFGEKTIGTTLETINSVDTIAGATLTTKAYRGAIEDALKSVVVFGGGSVDIRDEAQKLSDNLKNALPTGNGEFEEFLITEKIEGIDKIYSAKNNAGFVYVVGESYVGIDATGQIVSETDDATKSIVTNGFKIISSSKLTEINLTNLGLPENIIKASKTVSGNYVFELKASGFGIYGDEWYNPSGEYIYISLCATKEKEIISIKTISQKETQGIGSACEDEKFYNQFVGKNDKNYKEIDGISGATITTDGYKTAVGRALEAIETLKGVN